MSLVALDLVKQHLRVDHDSEDWLLQVYLDAAEQAVLGHIQRPVYADYENLPLLDAADYDEFQMRATAAIRIAIMMLVAQMYDDRGAEEPTGDAVLPQPVRTLLAQYRVWRPEDVVDGEETYCW